MDGQLRASWQRVWHDLGALGAQSDTHAAAEDLVSRRSEPQRHYHTLQHLRECLATFDSVRGQVTRPGEVEASIWFHDAVYNLRESGNEEKSAELARRVLTVARVDAAAVERVVQMVLATRHTSLPTTPDEQWLVDVDLSILGAPPERFDEYDRQVQAEYSFVPRDMFRRKRREILASLAARSRLYTTAHFHDALEAQARANLARTIAIYSG